MACSGDQNTDAALGVRTAALVHGTDDRLEYYAASEAARLLLEQSAVALLPKQSLIGATSLSPSLPSWAESDGLCPGERFADQPAAAFCSGVLVDWDLVLTAGHCARVVGLDDLVVALGYYYTTSDTLDLREADVLEAVEIEAEALDPRGLPSRFDYAWIRISRSVAAPRRPAAVSLNQALAPETSLLVLGTPGGIPFKADEGSRVQDSRVDVLDYFSADTDTSHGASGGGAFDPRSSLVGVLARGGRDFEKTETGCLATATLPDGTPSEEQFSYAASALAALCERSPHRSVCREDCGDPCEALPPAAPNSANGCALARKGGAWPDWLCLLTPYLGWQRRRVRIPPSSGQPPKRRNNAPGVVHGTKETQQIHS